MPHTDLPAVPPDLAARGVTLRHRSKADTEFVRDVYVAYRWEEVKAAGWPQEMALAFLHDQFRLQSVHYDTHYPGAAWGIVEVEGQPAGRLYLQMDSGGDLRIIDIAFMPPYRNRGFGGGLIAAVQDHARATGAAKVSIHVERQNPALRLYRRLGFQPVQEGDVYFLLEWPVA
ncbi:GNAT family N-acetyltransferase [Azospirillum sp. SYSU D00513]|uniref:GNAT family N-acetyltransferase n=1 Tax=Azospirillum sp. SYSU D00513 TaxID=2812561 RepID=UPI001A977015|nr:GNAT family N-acetyltransferase [Azospirillum sp. SYSU D00513]